MTVLPPKSVLQLQSFKYAKGRDIMQDVTPFPHIVSQKNTNVRQWSIDNDFRIWYHGRIINIV